MCWSPSVLLNTHLNWCAFRKRMDRWQILGFEISTVTLNAAFVYENQRGSRFNVWRTIAQDLVYLLLLRSGIWLFYQLESSPSFLLSISNSTKKTEALIQLMPSIRKEIYTVTTSLPSQQSFVISTLSRSLMGCGVVSSLEASFAREVF